MPESAHKKGNWRGTYFHGRRDTSHTHLLRGRLRERSGARVCIGGATGWAVAVRGAHS